MTTMPPMLAYTIQGSFNPGAMPQIIVGQGANRQFLKPDTPMDDSYDLAALGLSGVSRMAINAKGDRIAFVAEQKK